MDKPFLYCSRCSQPYHYRLKKNWAERNFLFFIPIQKFFCAKCLKSRDRCLILNQFLKTNLFTVVRNKWTELLG